MPRPDGRARPERSSSDRSSPTCPPQPANPARSNQSDVLACRLDRDGGAQPSMLRRFAVRSMRVRDELEEPMATKSIVGVKVGMTQVWDDANRAIPVTVVAVAPCRVVQVKTPATDGYGAVQVTYGSLKPSKLSKPELGHFAAAGVEPGRRLVELRIDEPERYEVGQELRADLFVAGERVDVTGVSKGKGFAGVMKRHNFGGLGASHGAHKVHRAPGAIGACATPSRVFKGTRMAGRMGHERVTVLNLEVVSSDGEREVVLLRGAVPGARGGLVVLRDAVAGRAPSAGVA